jgi:hypothetical protein
MRVSAASPSTLVILTLFHVISDLRKGHCLHLGLFPIIFAKKKVGRPIPRSSGRATMAAPSRERTGEVFLWKPETQLFLEKQSMF